jgi:hypothetical protein
MQGRRYFTAFLGSMGLSAAGLLGAVVLEACGSGADTTFGKRVLLHTRVTVDAAATGEFTNAPGWKIQLSKAAIAAGPFYYFDGAPPLVETDAPRRYQYAQRLLGIGTAHAHPGHYVAGDAMGQMLERSSIDLLAGPADFPDGEGITGTYRSARFTIAEPTGPAAAALDGHSVVVEGVARRDDDTRYFRASSAMEDVLERAADGKIEGCELSKVDVQTDGTITVTVDPRVWLFLVDFATADPGTEDEPAELPRDSDARIAFQVGATQLSAYQFAYSPD